MPASALIICIFTSLSKKEMPIVFSLLAQGIWRCQHAEYIWGILGWSEEMVHWSSDDDGRVFSHHGPECIYLFYKGSEKSFLWLLFMTVYGYAIDDVESILDIRSLHVVHLGDVMEKVSLLWMKKKVLNRLEILKRFGWCLTSKEFGAVSCFSGKYLFSIESVFESKYLGKLL